MAELLLEILSEEIPARMQEHAAGELWLQISSLLDANGINYENTLVTLGRPDAYSTPRRLTVRFVDLPIKSAGATIRKRGPRLSAPQHAIDGFRRSLRELTENIHVEDDEKGERFYVAYLFGEERLTTDVLSEGIPRIFGSLIWPKSMRWGSNEFRWARPLNSILCILDGQVVPFSVSGIVSGNETRGHRFMAPSSFAVSDFADYVAKLWQARVVLDSVQRRKAIARGAEEWAARYRLVVDDDSRLFDELKGLVEWPVPLLGAIDEEFMGLPPEALVTTMRNNQKYLALRTPDGSLARQFVLVANIEAADGGAAIVAGNERVLRARLWDAKFFWDQDRKAPLESRLPKLDQVVFHAELGTQGQRVERLVALAGVLVPFVPGASRPLAERAALLAKADLISGMVGEFPELQGIMGGHYATAQGEPPAVAAAIREHYAPKGLDDLCPTAAESVVVALADRLDTLAGFFAAGIRPSGSKDPFALRRAGLGIIRLVFENRLRLPLRPVVAVALAGYGDRFGSTDAGELAQGLIGFLADRLKVHLRERGIRHDLIAAAFAVGDEDDLVRLTARAEALQAFIDSEDGRNLLGAFRRAGNIVAIEEKKDGRRYDGEPVVGTLVESAEKALHVALESATARIATALAAEDYGAAMAGLAALRRPVDEFFDAVMVNVAEPDLRLNRLLLLARIRSALQRVADFSLIEDAPRGAGAA